MHSSYLHSAPMHSNGSLIFKPIALAFNRIRFIFILHQHRQKTFNNPSVSLSLFAYPHNLLFLNIVSLPLSSSHRHCYELTFDTIFTITLHLYATILTIVAEVASKTNPSIYYSSPSLPFLNIDHISQIHHLPTPPFLAIVPLRIGRPTSSP